ncbi:MAG TPA: hypothetical protein VFQ16_08820 [Burkholderiaceae bacterium]|nr:hypothetical protein [Burkholderiaceae bacterium]
MMRHVAAALALGLCGSQAGATDAALARQQAEQRVRLAERLIADTPAAQRIGGSGQAQAIAHLDEGRVHLRVAEDALKSGDYAGARRAADQALQHIGQARRLVPDAPARQQAQRQRQEQRLAALERLLEAWRSRALTAGRLGHEWLEASALIGQARQLGEAQRFEESLALLTQAEPRVLAGMQTVIGARELDYTERAASPAEAWRIERSRHAALTELVPLALRELRPHNDVRTLIERYQHSSEAIAAQAQVRRDTGETDAALDLLRVATMYLQRALSAAGLVLPADEGNRGP